MLRHFLLAALATAACRPPQTVAVQLEPSAVLYVSQGGAAAGSRDGSEVHPFAAIGDALAAAPSHAVIRIGAGEFREHLVIAKPLVLIGAGIGKTRIVGSGSGTVADVRGDEVELRDLTVEGGAACVTVAGSSLRLASVELGGASEAGISGKNARLFLQRVLVHDVGRGTAGRGIDLAGGSVEARGLVFRAGGRRAIVLAGASGVFEDLDVRGSSLSALQATSHSQARVVHGFFEGMAGGALYAGASRLAVEGAVVRGAEYGVIGFHGSEVSVQGGRFSGYGVAGVALVGSHGSISDAAFMNGGTESAISIDGTDRKEPILIARNRIQQPGPMGVHVTESEVTLTGNTITGARLDREGDLGDAVFAVGSRVTLRDNVMRGNAGSGAALLRCWTAVNRNGFIENGRAGVLLLDRSKGKASDNFFSRNVHAGVELGEGAKLEFSRNRFEANAAFDVDAGCGGSGGNADLDAPVRMRGCP